MPTRRRFLTLAGSALVATAAASLGWQRLLRPMASTSAPPAEDGAPSPLVVALLSDPHTQGPNNPSYTAVNGKLEEAVADLLSAKPHVWLCNGDVTDRGYAEEYDQFKQIVGKHAKPGRLLVTTGNHTFYDQKASDAEALRRFCEAFGQNTPYSSHLLEGVHFVMLADEQWNSAPYNREWAWLSPEQLHWFEQVLAEHRDAFTVVCLHQPVQETVLWSHGGNDFGGTGQAEELRAILAQNPQVRLWLSGHTHQRLDQNGQRVQQGQTTFVSLGSTFYFFDGPNGLNKDFGASQSRVMEIWPDKVVIKARDHVAKAWMDDLEFSLPRG